ncbi:hypothetical protein Tco_0275734, partial [Tanacetum coccineum]
EGFLEQRKPAVDAAIRQAIDKLKTLEQGTSSAVLTSYVYQFARKHGLFDVLLILGNNHLTFVYVIHESVGIAKAMAPKNGNELDANQ